MDKLLSTPIFFNMPKSFKNKTVYITGGSSGIGLAVAKLLATLGADLLLAARSAQPLEKAQRAVEHTRQSERQRVATLSLDVGNHAQVYEKMNAAVADFGAPDILILSAGINTAADHFESITHEMFAEVMNVNVNGVRTPIHALLGSMKARRGHVVILSSAAALFGMFGYTAYAASKGALMGFAESLRYELAPLKMPLTVVFPPEVDTPMNETEAKTLPPQARAVKNMGGLLTPEFTAKEIVRAIQKKSYWCIPGRRTRFLYLMHRLSNGFLSRTVTDLVIRRAIGNETAKPG